MSFLSFSHWLCVSLNCSLIFFANSSHSFSSVSRLTRSCSISCMICQRGDKSVGDQSSANLHMSDIFHAWFVEMPNSVVWESDHRELHSLSHLSQRLTLGPIGNGM